MSSIVCAGQDVQPIKYDMLAKYEQNILQQRPLKMSAVNKLLKTSLRSFLAGNGITLPHISNKKCILVNMVFDLLATPENVSVENNDINISIAPITEPVKPVLNPDTNLLPASSYNANKNPAALDSDDFINAINLPQDDLINAINLPQSINQGVASNLLEPSTSGSKPNATLPSAILTDGSKQNASEVSPIMALEPCNAIYLAVGVGADFDDLDWDFPPACGCAISVQDLTKDLFLPQSSIEVLQTMTESPIQELVNFLAMYGEQTMGSGCRVQLLMQLRDLLEGELTVKPTSVFSFPASTAPSLAKATSSSTAKHPNLMNWEKTLTTKASGLSIPSSTVTSNSLVHQSLYKNEKKEFHLNNQKTKLGGKRLLPGSKTFSPLPKKKQSFASSTLSSHSWASGSSANFTAAGNAPIKLKTKDEQFKQSQQLTNDFYKMMMAKQFPQELGTTTSTTTGEVSGFQKAAKEMNSEKECCICSEQERQIAFIPCGHAVCCRTCAAKVNHCPVCRKKIKTHLNLYFS